MNAESGRIVVVTGGNGGIGRAIAEFFAWEDDQVVIVGRNERTLRSAAEALGSTVSWLRADVSRREEVDGAVSEILKRFGKLDVLVNNAGFQRAITTKTPLEEAEALWNEVQGANLKGSFLMAMAASPLMRRPGGRVINISSIAAFTGGSTAGALAYAAAKSGLLGLTYALGTGTQPARDNGKRHSSRLHPGDRLLRG